MLEAADFYPNLDHQLLIYEGLNELIHHLIDSFFFENFLIFSSMYSFIIYLITFFEPPKSPNKSPALTSSWPNIDGHKELTISLNLIFA